MRSVLRALGIAYAVYLALALLVITPALNLLPANYVKDNYGRELHTEWVILNPFKLSLDLKRLELSESDGSPFLGLGDTSVNLSLASLWQAGVVLDELRVHDISARVVHLGEGQFNFSDLIPPPSEEEVDTSTEPVGVTIHLLDIQASSLQAEDRDREKPYESQWNDFNLLAHEISTVRVEGKPYTLALTGPEGGRLEWKGDLSVAAGSSQGQLSINNLSLVNLGRVAEPWLAFHVEHGRFNVEGDYDIDWSETLRYSVAQGSVAVTGLELLPKDAEALADTALRLTSFAVSGVGVSSADLRAEIQEIDIDGFAVDGWMEEERISLQEMLIGVSEPTDEAETPAVADEEPDTPQWSAVIGAINLENSAVNFRTPYTDPGLLQISPISAQVKNLNWPLAGETPLQLALRVNERASLEISGTLELADGRGAIDYNLEDLALPWANPNLPEALKASITDGAVAVKGNVELDAFAPTQVKLDGAITDFAVTLQQEIEQDEGEETIRNGWKSVRVEGLQVDMANSALALKRVAIDDLVGRVHIFADGSINTSKAWQAEAAAADGEAESAEEPEQADSAAAADTPPWTFDIPEIILTDSKIDFMDQSLPIHFRTVIGDLEGSILGLSSAPDASAKVDIRGSVDSYSPVTLAGTVAPLREPMALDLGLKFKGLDMARLSPYSGTYAGRKIERGLLDLDLGYGLEDNQLKGDNRIRMDQLKLGEKVESDKAVDLPLDLAVAIMTDSSGVIDMQVPIRGDVDDPNFALGSVIATAVMGLIREVVTAPFTLLANLVGSEEDFQHINFAEGSAVLNDEGLAKVTELSTALTQRPQLSLVVVGTVDAESDRERLQKNTLAAQLMENGLSEEDVSAKGPAWEKAIERRFNDLPDQPEDPSSLTIRDKYLRVAGQIAVPDEQLLELAAQRALAVKTAFIEVGGMDAGRAVIGQSSLDGETNRFSGVSLELE